MRNLKRRCKLSKNALYFALLGAGLSANALAADLYVNKTDYGDRDTFGELGSVFHITTNPEGIPEVGPIEYKGFRFYGTYDVGLQYEARSVPASLQAQTTTGLITPQSRPKSGWFIAPDQEAQSVIGVTTTQKLFSDVSFVGRAQIDFVPTTLQLVDVLHTLRQNNGVPLNQQVTAGDGARAGQVFSGPVYAGLSHPVFGTVTGGRQTNLSVDTIGNYDPLLGAVGQGFSLLGFYAVWVGQGSQETPRSDSSVKYVWKNEFMHFAGFYANPDTDVKDMWQASAGFQYKGFSLDGFVGHANDQVSAFTLGGPLNVGSRFLGARIADTDGFGIFAKYQFILDKNELAGGRKDGPQQQVVPSSLTFTGGYENIVFSNPADGGVNAGHETIGGYPLGPVVVSNGIPQTGIVNNAYTGGDRELSMWFTTAKYQYDPRWSFTAGYYHVDQNSFGFGVSSPAYSKTKCSSSQFNNCSGTQDVVSGRVDYQWTRNVNIYFGAAYSTVGGGLSAGYQRKDTYDPTLGVRVSF